MSFQRFAVFVLLIAACGTHDSIHFLEDPSELEVAETTDFPAVVRVISPDGKGLCTGTFIHSQAVLTASHCTSAHGAYRVQTEWGVFTTAVLARHGSGVIHDPLDIALLVFDTPIADDGRGQVIPVAPHIDVGEEVRLVGFGCSDIDTREGTNVKRTGRNRVSDRSEHIEVISPRQPRGRPILGPENLSGTCFGDSGSPLLKPGPQGFGVTAVSHGGSYNDELLVSIFSDLEHPKNLAFLQIAEKSFGLSLTRPCEQASRLPQCHNPSNAFTGIVGLLKWLATKIVPWLWLW